MAEDRATVVRTSLAEDKLRFTHLSGGDAISQCFAFTAGFASTDFDVDPDKQDDSWLYLPSLRRVRRLSSAQRSDAMGRSRGIASLPDWFESAPWRAQRSWCCPRARSAR